MKWPQVALPHVTEINPRRPRDLGVSNEELVSFVPMAAVSELSASVARLETRPYAEVSRGFTYFAEDDVLFAKITPCMENGKSALARELRTGFGFGSTEFHVLRAQKRLLLPEYLHYFIRQEAFRSAAKTRMRGAAGQQRVPASFLEETLLPLPTLTEQRRIVEILDQADVLRQQRRAADEKTQRILPALFYRMFGDPATNPMGWQSVELRKLGTPLSGGGFPLEEQGATEGEIPLIKVSDMNSHGNEVYIRSANNWVTADTLKKLRIKAAPPGTTVFPKIGAAVATNKKRLLVRATAYDNNVIGVVPHDQEWANYIFAFFQLFDLNRLTRTTAIPSIKTSELAALPIPRPDGDVVEAFDERFRQIISLQEGQRISEYRVNTLFDNLLHRAFTGELTAKWREAHREELEAEIQAQGKALAKYTHCPFGRNRQRRPFL